MSTIGREIEEAAEAEIAKKYPAEPHYHWRRFPESVTADSHYTMGEFRDKTVVAVACGRLVEYQSAVGDPDNSDCRECAAVYFMLNPPGYVSSGV